jgi:hypothetical protein
MQFSDFSVFMELYNDEHHNIILEHDHDPPKNLSAYIQPVHVPILAPPQPQTTLYIYRFAYSNDWNNK